MSNLKTSADTILQNAVTAAGGVPGVVAMITDRTHNIYEGSAGVRALGGTEPMFQDAVFSILSTTKAMTGTALFQLIEEGKVQLTDAAKQYVPALADLEVLEGFDSQGQPITRPAKRDITVNDLILHTSGLGYEFFSHDDLAYRTAKGTPSLITSTFDSIKSVLLFEPGSAWNYGTSIDYVGKVVEQLRGQSLGDVLKERVFIPLEMHNTAFVMSESMTARLAPMHQRDQDGRLYATDFVLPQNPEMHMGGHGIFATVGDYMQFIRMFLNDGTGPAGRVLKPETVQQMVRNGLHGSMKSGGWRTSIPSISNDGEFFPSVPKSWGYTFQINETDAPTGRPAGSVGWAGLANLYYWIDRQNGIGGFWATQIFPFYDPASYFGFQELETAAYRSLQRS
jgi:methyl acetate hydrolase